MIRGLTLLLFLAVHGLSSVSSLSAQTLSVDPSGTWRWSYELNGKTREDALTIAVEDDKVTGTFLGVTNKPVEIKEAKLKDNQLSCKVEYTFEMQTVGLEFIGKVKNDDLDGTLSVSIDGGSQDYPWTPKRSVRVEDAIGQWNIVIDADGNKLEPSIVITQIGDNLQGKYTVIAGTIVDTSSLRIRDNKLEFKIEATIEGRKIKADYSGRPYGNNMKGKIQYDLDGNEGEIDFAAKRQTIKK